VEEEARKMPIELDIRDHETLGPLFIKRKKKGGGQANSSSFDD
jgi:hypothetical protein